MRNGTKTTASWVYSIGTVTPPDPPRTQFFRWQNPSFHKTQKIGLKNDRHVITGEWKLVVKINGRNDRNSDLLSLPLGSHHNLSGGVGRLENPENRERQRRKVRFRVRNSRRHVGMSISWLYKSGITSKMPDHNSKM